MRPEKEEGKGVLLRLFCRGQNAPAARTTQRGPNGKKGAPRATRKGERRGQTGNRGLSALRKKRRHLAAGRQAGKEIN